MSAQQGLGVGSGPGCHFAEPLHLQIVKPYEAVNISFSFVPGEDMNPQNLRCEASIDGRQATAIPAADIASASHGLRAQIKVSQFAAPPRMVHDFRSKLVDTTTGAVVWESRELDVIVDHKSVPTAPQIKITFPADGRLFTPPKEKVEVHIVAKNIRVPERAIIVLYLDGRRSAEIQQSPVQLSFEQEIPEGQHTVTAILEDAVTKKELTNYDAIDFMTFRLPVSPDKTNNAMYNGTSILGAKTPLAPNSVLKSKRMSALKGERTDMLRKHLLSLSHYQEKKLQEVPLDYRMMFKLATMYEAANEIENSIKMYNRVLDTVGGSDRRVMNDACNALARVMYRKDGAAKGESELESYFKYLDTIIPPFEPPPPNRR